VVLATVGSSSKSELEFWDLDFNVEDAGRREGQVSKEEWGSGIQLLGTADHYAVTDVEWDPSGRYLATSASSWTHTVTFFHLACIISHSHFHFSSKMATPSGISGVRRSLNKSRTGSSNSFGARGPEPCSQRISNDKCAKTCANTAAHSTKTTQRRRAT
jgi:uncharacterized protein with WD repeat